MVTAKCLPVLYLLITLPTSTPMGPAPVSFPAWTRAVMGARSFSVAASSSVRVRARSAARTGLRQAMSRSPGKRGGDLGQFMLVEQGELQRAVVGHELLDGGGAQRGDPPVGIRPGGPVFPLVQGPDPGAGDDAAVADHDHVGQAELLPDHVHDGGERGGVAGVAGEDPDRDRAAFGVGGSQYSICSLPFLPCGSSRGRPAGSASLPATRTTGRTAPSATGWPPGRGAAGQLRLDRVLPVAQPVHRSIDVIGGRPGHAEVGAQGGVGPPGQGGQLGAGLTTREMISVRARSRWGPAGPSSAGSPSFLAMA